MFTYCKNIQYSISSIYPYPNITESKERRNLLSQLVLYKRYEYKDLGDHVLIDDVPFFKEKTYGLDWGYFYYFFMDVQEKRDFELQKLIK
jgi:hypothetical protein